MITEQQTYDGKAAEYMVCTELLKRGYEPFIPLLDRGIDIIIKSGTKYYDIQVKSNNSPNEKNQQWFVFQGDLKVSPNLIYILVDMINLEYWIIPSRVVYKYGNQCRTQFDLHLKQRKHGDIQTRGELLNIYKGNWEIFKDN